MAAPARSIPAALGRLHPRRHRASDHTAPDAHWFGQVYEEHHQAIYRYCRSIVRHEEDARDALQASFAKAFAAVERAPRGQEVRPWLFRIARNEAIDLLRRRRETEPLESAGATARHWLEEDVERREDLRLLRGDLADLAERHRSALVLRELIGLGHEEIAAVLETTPRAVKQVIFEARTALGECRGGRAMACEDVCRAISDGDRRKLRARRVRAHLRECSSCRAFEAALGERSAQLAALAPALPAGIGAAIFGKVAGAAKAAGATAAGAAAGASASTTATGIGAVVAAKAGVVAVGATATIALGIAVTEVRTGGPARTDAPARVDSHPRAPQGAAAPRAGDPGGSRAVPASKDPAREGAPGRRSAARGPAASRPGAAREDSDGASPAGTPASAHGRGTEHGKATAEAHRNGAAAPGRERRSAAAGHARRAPASRRAPSRAKPAKPAKRPATRVRPASPPRRHAPVTKPSAPAPAVPPPSTTRPTATGGSTGSASPEEAVERAASRAATADGSP